MILAHSLIGVPITHYLIKNKSEFYDKPLFANLMYGVGIVAAVFPDFDLILSFFINDLDHRKLISHSIVPYLVLFCFGILLSKIFKKYSSEIKILNLIFFIGIASHLFLDALVGGVSLFSPITNHTVGLPIFFDYTIDFYSKYFTSFYFLLELPLIVYSLYMIAKLKNLVSVVTLPFLFLTIAIFMVFSNF